MLTDLILKIIFLADCCLLTVSSHDEREREGEREPEPEGDRERDRALLPLPRRTLISYEDAALLASSEPNRLPEAPPQSTLL